MDATSDLILFADTAFVLDESAWAPGTVRGADKVAQRVLYAVQTPQGSVPGRPTDGSLFLSLAEGFRSEFDVFVAWASAESAIVATVQAAELADEPDAEKLGSVQLTGVTVIGADVTVTVTVTAKDGSLPTTPVEFVIPV